ncbi:MAG: histidinol dehydrogenase [Aquiluna sp.]
MRKLIWSGEVTALRVRELIPRAAIGGADVETKVAELIGEVKNSGEQALRNHSERFDGVVPKSFKVAREDMAQALEDLDPALRTALEKSIARVRSVSQDQLPAEVLSKPTAGGEVRLRNVPVDSVGLYVPGGKAVYPSSTIMNVVPAQVAEVPRLVICTPPQKEFAGLPHPTILATAELLGVSEVFAIGGASAVAAMAYGVESIGLEPVRMVTGPGNIFVATAKGLLRGQIAIDSEAGPTEVMVIADEKADARLIAADLISQAEHDENAAAVLLTDSDELIAEVAMEVERQTSNTPNRTRVEASLAGQQSVLCKTASILEAIAIANEYATEHLEIMTANARDVAAQIRNAGAVFVGANSPVSLGDYLAGSNHVLPTSEQAKFYSGLSVQTFLRQQQVISYSQEALREVVDDLSVFADAEGLGAHGEAARIRFES